MNMGIETLPGLLSAIIKKNTNIPISKNKIFETSVDNQTAVSFKVYEGERSMANDNHFLGEFILENVEKAPKG